MILYFCLENLKTIEGKKHINEDPSASSRKLDHIKLAFQSAISVSSLDQRFSYEPMLAPLSGNRSLPTFNLGGKTMNYPIWISSMTGGTELANTINKRLAAICGKYKLGMGLGSCRQLLYSDEYLDDFSVRQYMPDQPLYANLGIAQVEQLLANGELSKIKELIIKLEADGLIVHVNPLQEWLQPEGDKILKSPIETIRELLVIADYPVIVKEVGQGFGKESLRQLLTLPLEAIDFAANGGTNFSKIELYRSDKIVQEVFEKISYLGHDAESMVLWTNQLIEEMPKVNAKNIIVSGGIKNFLDGYYFTQKVNMPSIYGMASGFLKYALESVEALEQFTELQLDGLKMANALLKLKDHE